MGQKKHQYIYNKIYESIMTKEYQPGQKLPTEQELAKVFKTSRPTAGRALRDLEQNGLITRRQGSGSFVHKATLMRGQRFGILMPWGSVSQKDSNHGIFGPMVSQILSMISQNGYSLALIDSPSNERDGVIERAMNIGKQLIDLQVKGVFFMPLELPHEKASVNKNIVHAFEKAGISIVLLDRDICPTHYRSHYDLVGIDNKEASFELTSHILNLGCKKIDFFTCMEDSSAGWDRIEGYKKALKFYNIDFEPERLHHVLNPEDHTVVKELIRQSKPEAIICVNDGMAALFMHHILDMGMRIPQDIKIVGFDDLPFISYLPVPLTTVRQPINALAAEAVRTLLDRIANPDKPARRITVAAELIVRKSCEIEISKRPQTKMLNTTENI